MALGRKAYVPMSTGKSSEGEENPVLVSRSQPGRESEREGCEEAEIRKDVGEVFRTF